MAMARVVCASQEMDPKDMAPVANLLKMLSSGSTSSIGIDVRVFLKSSRLLSVQAFSA